MLIKSVFCLIRISVVSSHLTEWPSNEVSVVESQTVLKCNSTSHAFGVSWFIYRLDNSSCQFFGNATMVPGCVNQTRYWVDVNQTAWKNYLMINNTELSDAATYICQDNTNSASAVYGVIGI